MLVESTTVWATIEFEGLFFLDCSQVTLQQVRPNTPQTLTVNGHSPLLADFDLP